LLRKNIRLFYLSVLLLFVSSFTLHGMSDSEPSQSDISDCEDDVIRESRAIIRAIRTGDCNAIDDLLLEGVDANMFDGDQPILTVALRRGYWHVARRLLEDSPRGSHADAALAETGGSGMTPLHVAVACAESEEHRALIAKMISFKSTVSVDLNGLTPFDYALLRNDALGKRMAQMVYPHDRRSTFSSSRKRLAAKCGMPAKRIKKDAHQTTLDNWLRR